MNKKYIEVSEENLNLILETLTLDSNSSSFSEDLKEDLSKCLEELKIHDEHRIINLDDCVVPNWFTIHHMRELTGLDIDEELFKEFQEYINNSSGYMDEISCEITEAYNEFLKDRKNK